MTIRALPGLVMIATGALLLGLILGDAFPKNQEETSFWLEHVAAWSTLIAATVAAIGLGGVYFTLREGRRQQRVQSGPYVRVDVGPEGGTEDFEPPVPHYSRGEAMKDFAPEGPDTNKVSFWAWLTNYQVHRLGFALAVTARFVIEARTPREGAVGDGQAIAEVLDVQVPYLEHGKPVAVELFRVPRDWEADVWLASLVFHDFYDERHEHWWGESTNALHGRLSCEYIDGRFMSVPEARPRGRNVDFE